MPKRKNTEQQKNIDQFIKALEKPINYSYGHISAEQKAAELKRIKKAVTVLLKNEFSINTNITTRIGKRGPNQDKTISGTPLHFAAFYLRKYFLEVLIEKGADVNATNDEGLTPIQLVILNPYRNWTIYCLTLLVEHGAKLDVVDEEGRTLLDLCTLSMNNTKETVNYLIDHGVTYSSKHEPNLIEIASQKLKNKNYVPLVKEISSEKINASDQEGRTFLHYAAYYGRKIHSLLAAGADADSVDNFGRLPLHYALLTGNMENIKKLYNDSSWNKQQHICFADKNGNNLLHFIIIGALIRYFAPRRKKGQIHFLNKLLSI